MKEIKMLENERKRLKDIERADEDLAVIINTDTMFEKRPRLEADAYLRLVAALRASPSSGTGEKK